jgi:uncharacterized protein
MARFLLDSSVLIALTVDQHSSHRRAHEWYSSEGRPPFATCPTTQGALVRFLVRQGAPIGEAKATLQRVINHPQQEFWATGLTYLELPEHGLTGHRQVTDYYLAALAQSQGARLATLDRGLNAVLPGICTLV